MDTITIKQKKYEIIKFSKSGVLTEVPGILAGAKILTNGYGGNLKIFDARSRNGIEPLLSVECKEGRQENEQILIEPKKYEGGIAVKLEGINAEARLYHKPFDIVSDIHRILEIKEKEEEPQWVTEHQFNLDTAKTNYLLEKFPGKANYVYVKSNTGQVTAKFDRPSASTYNLIAGTQFKIPFGQIYLTWATQANQTIEFYISNKEYHTQDSARRLILRTETALGTNAVYNSDAIDVDGLKQITLLAFANQASANNGLKVQQSIDGTNWDSEITWTLSASTGRAESVEIYGRYVRIQLTNGAVAQTTLRLAAWARKY